MKRKSVKCTFNPLQAIETRSLYGFDPPVTYGISINRRAMMKAVPPREHGDYSPRFVEWFVNFHAVRLHIHEWDRFPEWMVELLKSRAEEIHEGLHFNR